MKILKIFLILLALILIIPVKVLAQSYSFEVPEATVDVFWNQDGTLTLNYEWLFQNRLGAAPIDYIDMGLPSGEYDLSSITAEVDGKPITDIQVSPYVKNGVALGLGANAIQPGQTGRVRAIVPVVRAPLFADDSQEGYVSANFEPTFFDSKFVEGNTNLTVVFHLPPGVQSEEPRWHSAPSGFPDQPESALDSENRIVYIWKNPNASSSREYVFGASFPAKYIPNWTPPSKSDTTTYTVNSSTGVGATIASGISACFSFLPVLICFGLFGLIVWAGANSGKRRKLQYLPPKVSIEGHGIKRGLTAVEAAILMEQPVDKIMTMILFSVIKKGAASVKTRDPLELTITVPAPDGLYEYEKDFLEAFSLEGKRERRNKLQDALIKLINSVAEKIKGFSRKETIAYYEQIIENAWKQVEAADTPEVKSEKYDEVMDWTMLDKDYDDRTRRVFTGGPVFVPVWWPRYDPTFPRPTGGGTGPVSTGGPAPSGTGGGKVSLPTLPGSDFAASMVNGVQTFAATTLGNVAEFTGNVTNKTNPLPAPSPASTTWRGSSGGGGTHCVCACACACAGCACACAGGGR